MRQDETDVNFLEIKPESLEAASARLRDELNANRRALERTLWAVEYVRKTYPKDTKLIDALETAREYMRRVG